MPRYACLLLRKGSARLLFCFIGACEALAKQQASVARFLFIASGLLASLACFCFIAGLLRKIKQSKAFCYACMRSKPSLLLSGYARCLFRRIFSI
jgi:hypothetical protein